MEYYDGKLPLHAALNLFFEKLGVPGGGYEAKTFLIKVGPIPFNLPNSPSRIKVAKLHDVHHVLTGYPTTWIGEAGIAGWELARGCGRYWMGWFFNIGSFFIGLFLWPRFLFRSFLRGRRSRTNLYGVFEYSETLLTLPVEDLRRAIGLDAIKRNSLLDYLLFIGLTLSVLLLYLGPIGIAAYWLRLIFFQ